MRNCVVRQSAVKPQSRRVHMQKLREHPRTTPAAAAQIHGTSPLTSR